MEANVPLEMLRTRKMQRTLVGTAARSMQIASSSSWCRWSSSPARRSPLWDRPYIEGVSPSTAPRIVPFLDMNTADTSMSTSPTCAGDSSPPMPTRSRLMDDFAGRGAIAPLSISKLMCWCLGAYGISRRMMSPIFGSKMSKKCWPMSAGSCISCNSQPPSKLRRMIATMSTSARVCSSPISRMTRPSSLKMSLPLRVSPM
mmetsp:Transcript_65556/g.200767  ORF Transcript_65556/g.200767 Transcript_65556/m.200767 type:complete len:201 (+) Transcript_65556:328-930(+)